MPRLHIEHGVTDLDTWLQAFDAFESQRKAAGVTQVRIGQPKSDPHYVMIDLEFETTAAAENFHEFLRTRVWPSSNASKVMTGESRAVVLTEVKSQ